MKELEGIKLGETFKPNPELKTLFYLHVSFWLLVLFFPWYIYTLLFTSNLDVIIVLSSGLVVFLFLAIIWIRLKLTQIEMEWSRGV